MKGKLCFVAAALVACILTAPFAAPRAAAENSVLPDFSDNFDSYEAGGKFIEENEEFAKNWTNNVLAGGEEQGIDAHLKGIGKIEYENGESGNKVLTSTTLRWEWTPTSISVPQGITARKISPRDFALNL